MAVQLEGVLKKKSPGFGGGWQDRYFVLTEDSLAYGKALGEAVNGRIPMETIITVQKGKTNFGFDIVLHSGQDQKMHVFALAGKDEAECQQWMDAVSKYATGGRKPVPVVAKHKGKFWKQEEAQPLIGGKSVAQPPKRTSSKPSLDRVASSSSRSQAPSPPPLIPEEQPPVERKESKEEKDASSSKEWWEDLEKEAVIHRGVLRKKSPKMGWQVREFFLYNTILVYWKKGECGKTKPSGAVPMLSIKPDGVTIVRNNMKATDKFEIQHQASKRRGVSTMTLQAKNDQLASEWVSKILGVMSAHQQTLGGDRAYFNVGDEEEQPAPPPPPGEGEGTPTPPRPSLSSGKASPRPPARPSVAARPSNSPKPPVAAKPPTPKVSPLPKNATPEEQEAARKAMEELRLAEEAAAEAERQAAAEAAARAEIEAEAAEKAGVEAREKYAEKMRIAQEEREARIAEARKKAEAEQEAREAAERMMQRFNDRRGAIAGDSDEEEGEEEEEGSEWEGD